MIIVSPSSLIRMGLNILTDENFFSFNSDYLPLLSSKITTSKTPGNIPVENIRSSVPTLDLFSDYQNEVFKNATSNISLFDYGFINRFSVSPIKPYKEVDTFTYSNYTSTIENKAFITELKLDMNVLLPFDQSNPGISTTYSPKYSGEATSNAKFQEKIYRMSLFPFVPAFFITNLKLNNLGQPLFLETFKISVRDNSPVDISATLKGGTTTYIDNSEIENNTLSGIYRTGKIYDCYLAIDLPKQDKVKFTSDLYDKSKTWLIQGKNIFINGMELNINNNLELTFSANDGLKKTVIQGVKFINMKKRTVSGSISFVATQNLSDLFYSSSKEGRNMSITMYFGGTFFYPLSNVTLQQFNVEVSGDQASYIHNLDFIALIKPTQNTEYYKQNQFDIDFSLLQKPIDGKLKIISQKNMIEPTPTPVPSPNK